MNVLPPDTIQYIYENTGGQVMATTVGESITYLSGSKYVGKTGSMFSNKMIKESFDYYYMSSNTTLPYEVIYRLFIYRLSFLHKINFSYF
jgi:hypothetical protein